MMRNKGIQYQQYEVINVKPLIIKFYVKDENITLMLYMIPQVVEIEDNKVVSVVSTSALSIFSDKPKMGELCSPQNDETKKLNICNDNTHNVTCEYD